MNLESLIKFRDEFNFYPKTMLDIGANNGYFSKLCLDVWTTLDISMIECNPYLEQFLKSIKIPYEICLLGNENKENVPFYISKKDRMSTGCSIYKEISEFFNDENCETIFLPMYKLDDITKYTFDLIKMDTQGSELDIIKGGLNTIKKCRYLLIEVSLIKCNDGAPLKDEIVDYLSDIGIKNVKIAYTHILNDVPVQEDIIFYNTNI